MKKLFVLIIITLISCVKNDVIKEIKHNEDDILRVYNILVDGISKKDVGKIISLYIDDANFRYSDLTRSKFACFNGTKSVNGKQDIKKNYEYLIKNKAFDRIEYEIASLNRQTEYPEIVFFNAWDYSDYGHYEKLVLTLIDGSFYIKEHAIGLKTEFLPY
ncbi:MAG TPA: hypothetical protein PLG34_02665 [Spirochaetota bacterium]|jgi:hypothetical protein|nr:MAG: hypothetical protein BWX91_01173 [Spirochaetes bacterium ADurb.Bin133]HNZ27943.1 hypothetical protein [Spirochaetota bacterium]HPY86867.1 hypothetical protein [Spirochaetota bacterium]